jgi:predicted RNA-binding protein with RPS1 domain
MKGCTFGKSQLSIRKTKKRTRQKTQKRAKTKAQTEQEEQPAQ